MPDKPVRRRPPAGVRSLYLAAYAEGARAASRGAPARACPYGPDRRVTQLGWVDGWVYRSRVLGRPVPVDAPVDETGPGS